jgi:DNA end-binding protein Ku
MPEQTQVAPPHRPVWSGTISFGLVSIPVNLVPAVREGRVSLRMLDESGNPLQRRYYCPQEERDVHPEHIVRGYQLEPEKYVIVGDDELESLAPEKSRDIDLRRFVKAADLDPIYFERAYFMVPSQESNKAYRLLVETMQNNGRAGLATFVMHDREYLVAILAEGGVLRAEIMRFQDEVRSPEDVGLPAREKAPAQEVHQMEKLVESMKGEFDPAEFLDGYKKRLLQLIREKQASRKDLVHSEPTGEADGRSVEDLMAALQSSLSSARSRSKPAGREKPSQEPRKARPRSPQKAHPGAAKSRTRASRTPRRRSGR